MYSGWLTKCLAGLLVVSAISAITGVIIAGTLLSSVFLEQQLTDANAYSRIASALTTEITKTLPPDQPAAAAAVQQAITPQAVQAKVDPALAGAEAYYKGEGPPPTIDLSDLTTQLQAAGIPIDPATAADLNKPIQVAPGGDIQPAAKNVTHTRQFAIIAAAVLALVLLYISIRTRRYTILPNAAIACGIALAITAAILLAARGVVNKLINPASVNSNALGSIVHDLFGSITHAVGMRFATVAGVLIVGGILARLFIHFTKKPAINTYVPPRPATAARR